MKQLLLLTLLAAISFLPSCKKEQVDNLNNNNNNNGTDTIRTGLGLLADPQAETYCVLISTGGDTLIWQNTHDTVAYTGGPELSFSSGIHPYLSSQFTGVVSKHGIKTFSVTFQNMDSTCSFTPLCTAGENLVKEGAMTINESRLILTSIDDSGDWLNTWNDNLSSPFQVVSITRTPVSGHCDRLHVKARFSNTLMHLLGCWVSCNVAQAEFVMDFQFNKQ